MFARRATSNGIGGPARVDRRTKNLVKRLAPGDVAVIDHEDLDRLAAEALLRARPAAIVNAAASMSGRYPNEGPLLVAAAGIPLVDGVGREVMEIAEGRHVRIEGGDVLVDDRRLASGQVQSLETLEATYEQAKGRIETELERFAENTLEYLRREHRQLLSPPRLPEIRTAIKGRQVLVVVRGLDYREDLAHLRSYVREVRPVLIGVDGGADALLEAGHRPDLIIGDFDSVSTAALRSGAELVVHGFEDGRAPGTARLKELGLDHAVFEAPGTSEDVAMVLAYELGAELIVAVGAHASMIEFLDKGREGMASTFLARLKVGAILVDAKGVSRLYATGVRTRDLMFFLAAAFTTFLVILLVAFPKVFLDSGWLVLRDLWRSRFG